MARPKKTAPAPTVDIVKQAIIASQDAGVGRLRPSINAATSISYAIMGGHPEDKAPTPPFGLMKVKRQSGDGLVGSAALIGSVNTFYTRSIEVASKDGRQGVINIFYYPVTGVVDMFARKENSLIHYLANNVQTPTEYYKRRSLEGVFLRYLICYALESYQEQGYWQIERKDIAGAVALYVNSLCDEDAYKFNIYAIDSLMDSAVAALDMLAGFLAGEGIKKNDILGINVPITDNETHLCAIIPLVVRIKQARREVVGLVDISTRRIGSSESPSGLYHSSQLLAGMYLHMFKKHTKIVDAEAFLLTTKELDLTKKNASTYTLVHLADSELFEHEAACYASIMKRRIEATSQNGMLHILAGTTKRKHQIYYFKEGAQKQQVLEDYERPTVPYTIVTDLENITDDMVQWLS